MKTPIQFPPKDDFNHAGMIAYRYKHQWPEFAAIIGSNRPSIHFQGSDTALIPVIFPKNLYGVGLGNIMHASRDHGELYLGLALFTFINHVIPDVAPRKLNQIAFRPNMLQSIQLIDLFSEGN